MTEQPSPKLPCGCTATIRSNSVMHSCFGGGATKRQPSPAASLSPKAGSVPLTRQNVSLVPLSVVR